MSHSFETVAPAITPQEWYDKVMRKCKESVEIKNKFFEHYARDIGELSQKMAQRFAAGHRLWVMGNGGSACVTRSTLPWSSSIRLLKNAGPCRRSIWSARYQS